MYGEGDEEAARRIEILKQQAATSPCSHNDTVRQASPRQPMPAHNFGGVYSSSDVMPPSPWAGGMPRNIGPYSMALGMNGGGGSTMLGEAQGKKTPPSPRVTPPTYRNRPNTVASSDGQFAFVPNVDQRQLPFGSAIALPTLPPQASPASASASGIYSPLSLTTDPGDGKRPVPHVYHDYSQVSAQVEVIRKKSGGVTVPFPEILYNMLEDPEIDPSVISWLPHGRAFLVKQPKRFTSEVMPKYFRQSKLTSFQRQLNLYGFRRLTRGSDGGSYYNELFLRGRPALCQHMKRQKVKGTGHKQPADANTEPNFYAMPPVTDSQDNTASVAAFSPPQYPLAEPMMHASPGLHGAAHLLRGFAGASPARLPRLPMLGPASAGATAGSGNVLSLSLNVNEGPPVQGEATTATAHHTTGI